MTIKLTQHRDGDISLRMTRDEFHWLRQCQTLGRARAEQLAFFNGSRWGSPGYQDDCAAINAVADAMERAHNEVYKEV